MNELTLTKLSHTSLRVGIVGALIGVLVFGMMLREAGGDPFVIVAIAEDSAVEELIVSDIGRSVTNRPSPGHDGQFFLMQAIDPLVSDPFTVEHMWPTRYRGQRMLYPLASGLGGTLPISAIPWTMAALQVFAFGLGTYSTAKLVSRRGLSPLWGMAFAINPGIWGALQIGGASTVAIAIGLYAVLQADRGRFLIAGGVFALSLLTRETMVLMLLGCVAQQLIAERKFRGSMFGLAVVPSILWAGFLRVQVPNATGDTNGALGLPLNGFSEAWTVWNRTDTVLFGLMTTVLLLAVLISSLAIRDLLLWACAPFAALFFILTPSVLRMSFDYSRAIAPAYTGVALLLALALQNQAAKRTETTGALSHELA